MDYRSPKLFCIHIFTAVFLTACAKGQTNSLNPSPVLQVKERNGQPTLLLDDKPIPPMFGDMSRAEACNIVDGALCINDRIEEAMKVDGLIPLSKPMKLTALVTHTQSYNDTGEGSKLYMGILSADDQVPRYYLLLSVRGGKNRLVMEKWDDKGKQVLMDDLSDWQPGKTVEMSLEVQGNELRAYLGGKLIRTVIDRQGIPDHKFIPMLGGYRAAGRFEQFTAGELNGKVVLADDFEDLNASLQTWGEYLPPPPFSKAGIHIYTGDIGDLGRVWKAPDTFDWTGVGEFLDAMARKDPQALLIPRFFFRIPTWWKEKRPDDVMMCMRDGDTSPKPLIIHGDNWPSYSSRLWLDQAGRAVEDLLKYLRSHPEGWRVVGLNVCAGHAKEWVYGFVEGYLDYSPAQRKGFQHWLKERYGSEGKLREAWNDSAVTFESVSIPVPAERTKAASFELINPKTHRRIVDYNEYHAHVVSAALLHFTKIIKDQTQGRMFTVAFYGYQLSDSSNFRTNTGCQTDLLRVLQSPYLDALASPHSYSHRYLGGSTVTYVPWSSAQLHGKMFFDENDTRTHLSRSWSGMGRTGTPQETVDVIRRDVAACISRSIGMWWWNWGKSWFDDRPTIDAITHMHTLMQSAVENKARDVSQIALVMSPESKLYVRPGTDLLQNLYRFQVQDSLYRIGAPFDMILLDDLDKARPYKLYIFLDTFHLNDSQRRMVHGKLADNNATALWFYAPGYVTDEALSLAAMSELTGINMQVIDVKGPLGLHLIDASHEYTSGLSTATPYTIRGKVGPLFFTDDPKATVLGLVGTHALQGEWPHSNGYMSRPGLAVKDMGQWRSVWSLLPVLPTKLLRNIATSAGVHIYCDGDDFVSADSYILSVHCAYPGKRTIKLPAAGTVTDAITNKVIGKGVTEFTVELSRGQTGVWTLSE